MLASVEAELLERIEASVQAHPIDPHQAQIFPLVGDLFALMAEKCTSQVDQNIKAVCAEYLYL